MEQIKEELPEHILIENLGALYPTKNSKKRVTYGIYKCGFCGNEFKAKAHMIKSKKVQSCGCYQRQKLIARNTTHGLNGTRIYNIWAGIKDRTLKPKNKHYHYYGGRGIKICDEWKNDFMSFYTWAMSNGYEENKGLSIDRIDNDGNYCPENCKWTTRTIQARNQRKRRDNTSGYKGVCFKKERNKYVAQICVNKNYIYLGYFKTAIEAGVDYNNYIIENNLEGFILNEIPQQILIEKENINGI